MVVNVIVLEKITQGISLLKEYRKNVFNYAISNKDLDMIKFNVVLTNNLTAGFSAININEEYKKCLILMEQTQL